MAEPSPTSRPVPPNADRIDLLQTFVRIVQAGSLSAAATQLGMTQPTVSRRLQTLERMLGLRLLQRSTHAMKLTEDGARCYDRARDFLANWETLETDLRGSADEPEGTLRVVVPHAFGQQMLVGPLAEYLTRHARVNVEWLLHDRTPDFIADGIDCAIHVGEVRDPNLVAIQLAEIPRIVAAAPQVLQGGPMPMHPDELARLPWLALRTFYRNEVSLTHARTGEVHSIGFRPRFGTDSLFAMRNAALSGLGVCVSSAWLLRDDLARGDLVHLVPEWHAAALPMQLAYPYARFYPTRLRRFIALMRELVPAAMATTTRGGKAS